MLRHGAHARRRRVEGAVSGRHVGQEHGADGRGDDALAVEAGTGLGAKGGVEGSARRRRGAVASRLGSLPRDLFRRRSRRAQLHDWRYRGARISDRSRMERIRVLAPRFPHRSEQDAPGTVLSESELPNCEATSTGTTSRRRSAEDTGGTKGDIVRFPPKEKPRVLRLIERHSLQIPRSSRLTCRIGGNPSKTASV